jgi:hypothetical protein
MQWLNGRYRNLIKKQGDFARQDYCTAADDLTKQRCTMLVDAGLIETSRYGNWQFSGFDKALQYFDSVFEAINQLSVDEDVQKIARSWFDRARPEIMLPLAWNYYLVQIEKHRITLQEDDYEKILVPVLKNMVQLGIRRLRLIELFSLVHIINEKIYCNPINIFTTLQSMASVDLVRVNNNHGDPIVTIHNIRGIMILGEEE